MIIKFLIQLKFIKLFHYQKNDSCYIKSSVKIWQRFKQRILKLFKSFKQKIDSCEIKSLFTFYIIEKFLRQCSKTIDGCTHRNKIKSRIDDSCLFESLFSNKVAEATIKLPLPSFTGIKQKK